MFGVLLLTYLVWRAGPAKLLESMAAIGWGLSLVIALGGVSHLVKTWAWRLTLLDEKHHVSFARMLGLRLGSEAVGQLGVLGQMFGETLRVSLLSSTIPLASGIASVTLDRAFFVLSAAVVSTVGMIAVLVVLPLPHALSLYAGLFVVDTRWRPSGDGAGGAKTLGGVFRDGAESWAVSGTSARWMERKRSLIHSVENKLLDFYHHTPRSVLGQFRV